MSQKDQKVTRYCEPGATSSTPTCQLGGCPGSDESWVLLGGGHRWGMPGGVQGGGGTAPVGGSSRAIFKALLGSSRESLANVGAGREACKTARQESVSRAGRRTRGGLGVGGQENGWRR